MRRIVLLVAGLSLVAAACGGADTTTTTSAPTADETTQAPTTTAGQTDVGGEEATLTATPAAGWTSTLVGTGIKPVLALDSTGSPAVAFLEERLSEGFVAYAAASEGWAVDHFVEGYFYGPIGLDFDPADQPNVVWHDHQGGSFDPELGDLTYGVRGSDGWTIQPGADDGHDGWDSVIAVGADGVVRAAGIDPAQFSRTDGVEYYELRDGTFAVEAIGTPPVVYEFNVGLAVGADGVPVITYYDSDEQSLGFARRGDAGWQLATVDAEGDAGKYSDVAVGNDGRAHISYLQQTGPNAGTVRYAVEDGAGGWVIEDVGEIADLETGHFGARRVTSIDLDPSGEPQVAFSDKSGIWLGSRGDGGWVAEPVLGAGELALGQLVSMEIDEGGIPHIAYWEVVTPEDGLIGYLTQG